MKAIVYHNYGPPDVLKYEEIEKPTPGDDQVLIKVRAASVNLADYARLKGVPFLIRLMYPRARADGILRPKDPRLGRDVAGEVEAVGRNITQFKPGDAVFGWCPGLLRNMRVPPSQRWLSNRITSHLSKPRLFR